MLSAWVMINDMQDDPTRLAEILVEFWKRNDRVIVGIKKVGEL
jgi:protein phosphatase methylesterase 1